VRKCQAEENRNGTNLNSLKHFVGKYHWKSLRGLTHRQLWLRESHALRKETDCLSGSLMPSLSQCRTPALVQTSLHSHPHKGHSSLFQVFVAEELQNGETRLVSQPRTLATVPKRLLQQPNRSPVHSEALLAIRHPSWTSLTLLRNTPA
jgi:hypothetical protein